MNDSPEAVLKDELFNIANANHSNFFDDTEFREWAQSRARWALNKIYPGILTTALLLLLTSTLPVHADVLPVQPSDMPPDPARPGWRPPHRNPGIPDGADPAGGYRSSDVDDAGGGGEPFAFDTFGRWQATPPSPLPRPVAPPMVKCRPLPVSTVPGPLPVLGVAAAWGWARRLRRRVRV